MHKVFILFIFFLFTHIQADAQNKAAVVSPDQQQELLLRMPLLSDKTAVIVESALTQVAGILRVEACYEVGTMIITYNPAIIQNENQIVNIIRNQEINSPVEPLTTRDISLIRSKYEVVTVKSIIK